MRLRHLVARGFRNLADLECEPPPTGAALLGANAQGKTNLLEAIYYPVLFRSFRGASDPEVYRFGGVGFHVEAAIADAGSGGREAAGAREITATYQAASRKKRITVAGEEVIRAADAVGTWVAVVFLPSDVGLASGPAAERRQYLDRLLSLADRAYLRALTRYRAVLAQRNSALRQGRVDVARAFDGALAGAGAEVVRARLAWVVGTEARQAGTEFMQAQQAGAAPAEVVRGRQVGTAGAEAVRVRQAGAAEQFTAELECLREVAPVRLRYEGWPELADPAAWAGALDAALARDRARGLTTVGPHRDDLALELDGRPLRSYGSTGQQRSAAVALKLIEIATLRAARGTEPALLLDDVFAELDRGRQERLARRLLGSEERQVFVTAPRRDELPTDLDLPVWKVEAGGVSR